QLSCELDSGSPLVRYGLVRVGAGPIPFAPLSVDPIVRRAQQGETFDRSEPDSLLELCNVDRPLDRLIVPAPLVAELRSHLQVAGAAKESLRVALRGRMGSGRRTLLSALLRLAGHRMAMLDLSLLAPYDESFPVRLRDVLREALLRRWWPCLDSLER